MGVPIGLIALALVILIGAYIVQPFFAQPGTGDRGPRSASRSVLRQRADLLAERNRIYRSIKELEFDYETNKLSEEMFKQQRHALIAQAVDVLQRLDALPAGPDRVEAALNATDDGP
jgi:hypothetical protein